MNNKIIILSQVICGKIGQIFINQVKRMEIMSNSKSGKGTKPTGSEGKRSSREPSKKEKFFPPSTKPFSKPDLK